MSFLNFNNYTLIIMYFKLIRSFLGIAVSYAPLPCKLATFKINSSREFTTLFIPQTFAAADLENLS